MEQLIRCIDTETTGFPNDQRAALVEVAAVDALRRLRSDIERGRA